MISIPGFYSVPESSRLHISIDILEEALEDYEEYQSVFEEDEEDFNNLKRIFIKKGNILQRKLGRKAWNIFYDNLMDKENGLLDSLYQAYVIRSGERRYMEERINEIKTLFDKRNVPVYAYQLNRNSKQSKSKQGGLYKLIVDLPHIPFHRTQSNGQMFSDLTIRHIAANT